MTITLNLPAQVEQAYFAEAQSRGLPVDEVVREVLMAGQPRAIPAEMPMEEWLQRFEAWTRRHTAESLPLLSDEAISRESIYRERGL